MLAIRKRVFFNYYCGYRKIKYKKQPCVHLPYNPPFLITKKLRLFEKIIGTSLLKTGYHQVIYAHMWRQAGAMINGFGNIISG